jgi:predicted nucleic acid-binding protein
MIHVDTSVVIAALTGHRILAPALRERVRDGVRLTVCTLVLYEWWRGPRTEEELEDQDVLFPARLAVPFDVRESAVAARLYGEVKRPRGRELDLAIAACAIVHGASFWTLNPRDFDDIPDLTLA